MNAPRRNYCLVRTHQPTKDQLADQYSRRNLFSLLESAATALGHPHIGSSSLKDYVARLDIHAEQQGPGYLFAVADRMARLNPYGRRRKYSAFTRQRYDRILLATGHWEIVRRNLYRWHRKPRVLAVPPSSTAVSKKKNLRSESPLNALQPKIVSATPISAAPAAAGDAFGHIFKNANTSAARAAARHAYRDPGGRYAAQQPAPAVQAAKAAVGNLKKMPESKAGSSIAELILAFGAAHPEEQNERIRLEEERRAKTQPQVPKPPEIPAQGQLTAYIVSSMNADYGVNLNIFKLNRAGITDEVLVPAAHFTHKKHLEQPFHSLEGAIVHAALQRKRGIW